MPGAVQLGALGFAQPSESVARRDLVQDQPVQCVDGLPGQLTAPHPVHRQRVAGAPVRCEGGPIPLNAKARAERGGLGLDAGVPIDDGTEDVEGQGSGTGLVGVHGPILGALRAFGAGT